jgi:hypothetical protein
MIPSLRAAVAGLAAVLLGACGADAPLPPVPARAYEDPGFVAAGTHEMRYAAIQASSLPAGVAAEYGILQRSDRLVVSVSVLERPADTLPVAAQAQVTGTWRALVGEPRALDFRSVTAAGSVSYVAEAPLRDREPIVLELVATPSGSMTPLRARLTRQFDVD